MAYYGYIRVSTKDQNPERQMIAMKEQNIAEENIYLDKMSGKDFDRSGYNKMIANLKKGDVVVVKSIDRFGRNYDEIGKQWRFITKEIGADIEVIDLPILNTNSIQNGLTGLFLADIVLTTMAYVAENERINIKTRQREGIEAAMARNVHFGRTKMEMPKEFEKYCQLWLDGGISLRKAAEKLDMQYVTFYRRCMDKIEEMEGEI